MRKRAMIVPVAILVLSVVFIPIWLNKEEGILGENEQSRLQSSNEGESSKKVPNNEAENKKTDGASEKEPSNGEDQKAESSSGKNLGAESDKQKGDPSSSKGSTEQDQNSDGSSEKGPSEDQKPLPWNLILVNPSNKLPEGFEVKLTELSNGHAIDERAYPDLQQMMDDARAEGLSPLICSSYRTMEKQIKLYTKLVQKYQNEGMSKEQAQIEASKWIAVPGTSEHQSGLAVDIVATSYQLLNKEQENTAEQKWLMANCYKYGFILRYPEDKTEVTGIGYEPWHYRYVGKEAAQEIFERKICLEEYLATLE